MKLVSLIIGIITLIISDAEAQTSVTSPHKPFPVFDATLYSGKPDLSAYGLQPITLVYAGSFGSHWHKQSDRLPEPESVKAIARQAEERGYPVVIDIEHWILTGTHESIAASLQKYLTVLQWFKESAPSLKVGYYGIPPIRDYWRAIKDKASQDYRTWKEDNNKLSPLTSAVDIYYPSLYTFYLDQAGWKRYAIAQIEEAKRCAKGKPIYVFLWPQFHDSNRMLGGRYLPEDYWQLELDIARQYADGVIIWGGWDMKTNRPAKWNAEAAWWKKTKEFVLTLP